MGKKKRREAKERRDTAKHILFALLISVGVLSIGLVGSLFLMKGVDAQLSGIVMTALAGAIASLLSFAGIIVKGLIDNLTRGRE